MAELMDHVRGERFTRWHMPLPLAGAPVFREPEDMLFFCDVYPESEVFVVWDAPVRTALIMGAMRGEPLVEERRKIAAYHFESGIADAGHTPESFCAQLSELGYQEM